MAIIAKHEVKGTPVTITISTLTRGFMVMTMGSPRLQKSVKVRTEQDAKDRANDMWREARAKYGHPTGTR